MLHLDQADGPLWVISGHPRRETSKDANVCRRSVDGVAAIIGLISAYLAEFSLVMRVLNKRHLRATCAAVDDCDLYRISGGR